MVMGMEWMKVMFPKLKLGSKLNLKIEGIRRDNSLNNNKVQE
jgi:hypothetical protein